MFEAHFAIDKRHIMRFVNQRRPDIMVPEDFIEALKFDFPISWVNCAFSNVILSRSAFFEQSIIFFFRTFLAVSKTVAYPFLAVFFPKSQWFFHSGAFWTLAILSRTVRFVLSCS